MKHIRMLTLALLGWTLCWCAQTASAEGNSETTMLDIMSNCNDMVSFLEDNDLEVVHIEMDLIFKSSNTKTITRNLSSDYTYWFVGFGDRRIADVDIAVYKKSGSLWVKVDNDNDDNSVAVCEFKPTTSGEYRIDVTAYKFKEGYTAAHFGIIIAHSM